MYARDHALVATPVGMIRIIGDEATITGITILHDGTAQRATAAAVGDAAEQIEQWFAGERRTFDLPLAPAKTPRGTALREGMIAISYGATETYGAFARRVRSSPRAIGQACARNPFPIVVPCHRVLASNGLGHYSAGDGSVTKQWLLDHEQGRLR